MRSWMIAFSLGVFFGGFVPAQVHSNFLALLFIPAILSARFVNLKLLAAYCLGLFWVLNWAANSFEQLLPAELERKDFWVRGVVLGLPEINNRFSQFVFEVESSCLQALAHCEFTDELLNEQKIRLSLYQQFEISPGQIWQFKVRLKRPHGFLNPGGFDYEAWLWQNEIRANGYVRNDSGNHLLGQQASFSFQHLRYQFRQKLNLAFAEEALTHLNLIKALSIGDRQNVSDKDWALFSATGTNHLMVISGMHVGFVVLLLYQLSKLVLGQFRLLALYFPIPRIAALIAVVAAYSYAGIAGFGLPVQRAFIMLAVFMLAQCCCRHSSVSASYCMALTLVLVINPLAPMSSGFWLSFIAVAVLVFLLKQSNINQHSLLAKIVILLKTQLYIGLGLLPFMLLFFQQISLSAPLVNLFAIPFVTLVLVPLCLMILLLSFISQELMIYCCFCAERLIGFFLSVLELLNQYWPQAFLSLPALVLWQWLVLLVTVFSALYSLSMKTAKHYLISLLSLLCLLPVLLIKPVKLELNQFQVDILDVGQGLALVIRTREHAMLYDLGPIYSDSFNAGEGVILPFLRSQNINQIDRVLISHGDSDHIGGLAPILLAFPEADYLSSDLSAFTSAYKASLCRAGQQWVWDGVEFQILHPDRDGYSRNNSSCVLKVSNDKYSILLTGDIESLVERHLIRSVTDLSADILIAPHHGSKTSSSRLFIEAVSPVYVVFSSGYLNQFNHPHPDIVNLYTNSGTISLNTAHQGTISWIIGTDKDLLEASQYRELNKRFWRLLL